MDSYKWNLSSKGEVKDPEKETVNFAQLLEKVALVHPDLRVRFSTSHPKDMTDEVLHTIAKYENICNYVHLPVQSGNSEVLKRMNRGYTREWYLDRIAAIKRIIPDSTISTDIITGFCGETEEQHQDTLSLMEEVSYQMSYMFKYSERPRTLAERKFEDDVPEEVKSRRLDEVIAVHLRIAKNGTSSMLGRTFKVLVEGVSKKSDQHHYGRNSQNTIMIFPKGDTQKGQYVYVQAISNTSVTLIGEVVQTEEG